MITVIIYAFRHGQKDGSTLTPFGSRQVIASVRKHILASTPVVVFTSDARRAVDSAIAAVAHGHIVLIEGPKTDPLLSLTSPEVIAVLEQCVDPNGNELNARRAPVSEWVATWPPALLIAERLRAFMIRVAEKYSSMDVPPRIVLFGHSPQMELALEGGIDKRLDFADGVRYELTRDDEGVWSITSATFLECPLPVPPPTP